jgi:hypothetical protein
MSWLSPILILLLTLCDAARVLKPKVKENHLPSSRNDHSYSSLHRSIVTLECFESRFELNVNTKPRTGRKVLSYGCANGIEVWALRMRFPKAQIVGTDLKFAHNATMMELAREQYGGNGTFATIEQAAKLGPFDLIVCHYVLYEDMSEQHVEQFFRGLVTNFLAHGGVIEVSAVIGHNDQLLRFPFLEHNARGNKHPKLDARVILDWLRVRSVSMTDAVERANAEQQRTGLLPPRHFNDKLELIRRCLYRSSNHDFVTLDVGEGRSLRGGRILQVVFSPHAPLVRKPYSPEWARMYRHCRWNFRPDDIWMFPLVDGAPQLRNESDLLSSRIFNAQCS